MQLSDVFCKFGFLYLLYLWHHHNIKFEWSFPALQTGKNGYAVAMYIWTIDALLFLIIALSVCLNPIQANLYLCAHSQCYQIIRVPYGSSLMCLLMTAGRAPFQQKR